MQAFCCIPNFGVFKNMHFCNFKMRKIITGAKLLLMSILNETSSILYKISDIGYKISYLIYLSDIVYM